MEGKNELTDFLKSLSDPTRLRIIEYLAETGHPRCVGVISKHVGISQSATSQHLRILRQSKLVTSDRRGYHVHYEVNTEHMEACIRQLNQLVKK